MMTKESKAISDLESAIRHFSKPERRDILAVQSAILKATHDFMWKKGILQMMPVILSAITDPLNHPVYDSSISYGGQKLQITKSMILHKQIAMSSPDVLGVYIVSPNVRLEMETLRETGRHLFEFSQVDIELKGASAKDFMKFSDEMYAHIFGFVKKECEAELSHLGRELKIPSTPFKVYDSTEAKEKYGPDFEKILSEKESAPFWVTDHYREFYDKQDPLTKKHINYDIFYPEGFGEGMSGAERETDYDVIIEKMSERRMDPTPYASFLEIARKGLLRPSAGAGFGVERLVRYITGRKHIRDATFFPRVPGEPIII
ncbi:MAG: asparagine synthetase A [Candidatus Micrarchaeia archaeon]